MNLAIALFLIAVPIGFYLIIRHRGASIMATFNAGGVGAVLRGFQTWLITLAAGVLMAAPTILEALPGLGLETVFPEPWATIWRITVPTGALYLAAYLRAQATTPTGSAPSGEA